jgi:SsrA-binding protein
MRKLAVVCVLWILIHVPLLRGEACVRAGTVAFRSSHHRRSIGARNSNYAQQRTALFANKKKKNANKNGVVSVNRLAFRNYEVLQTYEVGISLLGTEVKAIRDGRLNLRDGYIRPTRNRRGCTLHNVHIGQFSAVASYFQHEERRIRPLLVHKEEARKLARECEVAGITIIPLKAYFTDRGLLKMQIGLCRGKNTRDKRATIQAREQQREERRIIKNFRGSI